MISRKPSTKSDVVIKNPIPDNIVPVPLHDYYMESMARYSFYILYDRFVPSIDDGLKPVHRRILYCMWNDIGCISKATKRKSSNAVGRVIGDYNPHSDCLISDTLVYLSNHKCVPIGQLYQDGVRTFESLGINPVTFQIEPVVVHNLRIGQYATKIYHVVFSNGAEIACTENHPFFLTTGQYKMAKDLTLQDTPCIAYIFNRPMTMDEYRSWYDSFYKQAPLTKIYVEELAEPIPMYDFTVDTTSNMLFPLISENDTSIGYPMVCLHNSACYDAFKPLTNWFECKCPLICYDSLSGTIQGDDQAQMRYTESYLSPFTMDVVLADLIESRAVVDWAKTFDNRTIEPTCLPVKVPLLLVNGSFAIAIGERVEIPPHSLNDVIDATIKVLHDPSAPVVLIPDPCDKCEIVNTNWKKICNQGMGYFTERGIIDTVTDSKGNVYLSIRSTPDLVWVKDIVEKIEETIKAGKIIQITDIQDHSERDQLDVRLYLRRGSDPEYVKQMLYKYTQLQATKRVNFQVIINDEIRRISYKAYILNFIENRRNIKFRLYNARLQKMETRYHTIEVFISILESGDVETIIHKLRNQTATEEQALTEWLMKILKITPLQAKYILNVEIKKLAKGNLNKYKEEQDALLKQREFYIKMLTTPELIDQEIENELLEIRSKYGKPRMSVLISEAQASNIPQGVFKVAVYDNGTIKKMLQEDPVKAYKGSNPVSVIVGENDKDLLLFDELGKVFRLPISKIPLTDRSTPGMDLRLLIKNLTARVISVVYLPVIEVLADKVSKHFLVSITKGGLIKKMDLEDIISTTPSGIMYSKLNAGDSVCNVVLTHYQSDVIVYTKSKALRIPLEIVPHLKRATLGNIAMKTNDQIDGIAIITKDTSDLIIVTRKGYFNRITPEAMPINPKSKTGTKVIKLGTNDEISSIFTCEHGSIIRCYHMDGSFTDMEVGSIELGSTISAGKKLTKEIVKAQVVKL